MEFLKKNLLTLIIVIATIILAGIAIFTAVRLYQLRQQSVAPNAPASKPGASSTSCTISFNLTQAVHCDNKLAYKNDPANTAGNYNLDASLLIPAGGTIQPGDILVYQLNGNSPNRIGTDTVIWTDVLDPRLDWMDGSPCFTFDAATHTATCTLTGVPHTSAYSRTIRVKVKANADTSTSLVNNGQVKVSEAPIETCSIALNFATTTNTPTATPTTPPACGTTCTTTADCPANSGMTCSGNVCRNASCTSAENCICQTATPTATPTSTPTVTPTPTAPPVLSCGQACSSDSQCSSGMSCIGNVCKNPNCSSSNNCLCATATPTATAQPHLPSAGVAWPTFIGIGAGLGTLLLAIFLAL